MDLNSIAGILEGLEETIIYKLLNRAQFRANLAVYQPGQSDFADEPEKSLFTLRLEYQERMDSVFGRFMCPEERPFYPNLELTKRRVHLPENGLRITDYNLVNLSTAIIDSYQKLIPLICQEGDDYQYGSSVEHDVYAIQAVSRRIHFGAFFVAEAKYAANPQEYDNLIELKQVEQIKNKLTRVEIENKIIKRVKRKVAYAQAKINRRIRVQIKPEILVDYYRNTIIPLTKEGEVLYLINRQR